TTLRLWYYLYSYDTVQFDYLAVDIHPYPTGTLERLWVDGSPLWSPYVPWRSGWREATITLDGYRGQWVVARIALAMTNADGYYNTWAYVDDVWVDIRR
ncbi:MAG: hypothetical protein V1772_02180, partial [Chloroflexota bacterium]